MLASRSVYDRMLSRYKKNGQFTYFDIRDTEEDPEIVEGAYDTMCKWVLVSTVKDNKNILEGVRTFRVIVVYEDGLITEAESNSKSKLKRCRKICANGDCDLGYRDKNEIDYGYKVVYYSNGNVGRCETYKDKLHGQCDSYIDGCRIIGEHFNNKRSGDWKVIEKDGTETIYQYY